MRWVESVDIGSGFDAANPTPTFAPGTGPCSGPTAADTGHGSPLTKQQLRRLRLRRSLLLALAAHALGTNILTAVLVECQSWIVNARDSHNYLGFTSGDWLVHWFVKDTREEVRRLVQCASEANQGWSAASWLKLWLERCFFGSTHTAIFATRGFGSGPESARDTESDKRVHHRATDLLQKPLL